MKYNKTIVLLIFGLVIALLSYGFKKEESNTSRLAKINKNDVSDYIAVNECFMWIGNNGMGSHDPVDDDSGFYWPGGENATIPAIFADGLIWGAKVGREIRVNGATYRYGLQAGKILANGDADNPEDPRYRIYKIRKGWENFPPGPTKDDYETDYNEWPVQDGAPWVDVDGDGVFTRGVDEPDFVGDEVLWCVSNDMDISRSTFTYGTLPLGLEQHTLVFAFQRTGDLGDMVFKQYKLINKGKITIRDMVLGYWSDTDLGNAADDFTGCDLDLSLGYTYNGDNNDDDNYGVAPPAIGYDFFQGPIIPYDPNDERVQLYDLPDSAKLSSGWRKGFSNLPMTAFTFFINGVPGYDDPDLGVAAGSEQFYNYMTGKLFDGTPFVDPTTNQETVYTLTGDPVAGTGWYEGPGWAGGPVAGDRRHTMASGPFTMMPGDTQEVVVGIVIARGTDNLNSVTELKRKDAAAQIAYDLDFNLTPSPPSPKLNFYASDKQITLYWENNAESYDEVDPLIEGRGYDDETFTFEGYRIWQFSDLAGNNKTLLGSFDVANGITEVTQIITINGVQVEQTVFELADEGIFRSFTTENDAINRETLINGNPYYFSVTAFGYSPHSDPKYLENPAVIVEVFPGKSPVDVSLDYIVDDAIYGEQTAGFGDGKAQFTVIDPSALTGDTYKVTINGNIDSADVSYTLTNVSSGEVLLDKLTDFVVDDFNADDNKIKTQVDGKFVVDGFRLWMQDVGLDSINFVFPFNYRVKDVLEVKGPGGQILLDPFNVETGKNSTGKWSVRPGGTSREYFWQTTGADQGLGYVDYEIRFTGQSNYFLTGYARSFTPLTKDDPAAPNTVPFEIWDIGRNPDDPADDKKLWIKIRDYNNTNAAAADSNGVWSQMPNGNWEEIHAFDDPNLDMNAPFPASSGSTRDKTLFKFGQFIINGELPEAGTVIRLRTYKPLGEGDEYTVTIKKPNKNDKVAAKDRLNKIGVFPNPYYGAHNLELSKYESYVRFYGLPRKATVRIFSLSGVFIQRLDKNNESQFVDWRLQNKDGLPVASGMYIAYIDMPGIGTKTLKIAVIQEAQYIDRI